MSSRLRQSTGPTFRRVRPSNVDGGPSGAPRGTQEQRRVQLPEYEPPSHPLNAAAQQNLEQLIASRKIDDFDGLIGKVIAALSENAGSINEALHEKEATVAKNRARLNNEDEADNQDETERVEKLEGDLETMRDRVDTMTQKMEQDLMKMIDAREYFGSIRPVLREISNQATAYARESATQPQPTQSRLQRRRAARDAGDEDMDDEDEDEDYDNEEYSDFTPTDPTNAQNTPATQRPPAPTTLFKESLQKKKDRYQALHKRERYAKDNDYRQFRALVHEGRYAGEKVLSHEDTWFADAGVAPQPGVTNPANDSDDDLQIAKETISTKCPLTLQEFRHPVTSRKCPHSFEKDAIMGMIDDPANANRLRDGQRAVQCPVPGCEQNLTKDDLHADPVLLRKIRRIQKAMAEEEDDDDDGEAGGEQGNRARPHEIGSSPGPERDDIDDLLDDDDADASANAKRMKMERFSGRARG